MAKSNLKQAVASSDGQLDGNSILLAILALLVDERERAAKLDSSMGKTELILDNIGLSHQQIARVLNKNTSAVRMMVKRAKTQPGKASGPAKEA